MEIPSQTEMFKFVLEIMSEYPQFSRRQAKSAVCEKLNLSTEEQSRITSSGVPVYESRTGWAVSWLCAADYIARISRGIYIRTCIHSGGCRMGEGFCRHARQKIVGILEVFQDFLTQQAGKRSGQTAFNVCEYRFSLPKKADVF